MGLGKSKILSQGGAAVPVGTDNFQTITYTGTGSAQSTNSLSSQGGTINFQPDLIWFKNRTGAYLHQIYDSIRGVNKFLNPGVGGVGSYTGSAAERTTLSGYDLTSFNSNGFTVGLPQFGSVNEVGFSHVAWCFKGGGAASSNTSGSITSQVSANQAAGFSIVEFTTSSNGTIGHGLSAAPQLIITKLYTRIGSWSTYSEPTGNTKYLQLDSTNAAATGTGRWNSTTPSASTFVLGSDFGSGHACICYCFTSIPGYQKIGSYTGNGSTTGTSVTTGFEPRFLLIKKTTQADNWTILDKARTPNNPMENDLKANSAAAEQTNTGNNYPQATTSATGFQVNTTDGAVNSSGQTYIYLAIA